MVSRMCTVQQPLIDLANAVLDLAGALIDLQPPATQDQLAAVMVSVINIRKTLSEMEEPDG